METFEKHRQIAARKSGGRLSLGLTENGPEKSRPEPTHAYNAAVF